MRQIISMLLGGLTKTLGNWASVLVYGGTLPIQEWVINEVIQKELEGDEQISMPNLKISEKTLQFSCYLMLGIAEVKLTIPLSVQRLEIRGKRASLELRIENDTKIEGSGWINQAAAWVISKTHQPLVNGLRNDLFQIYWPSIHVDLMQIPQISSILHMTLAGMTLGDIMHVDGVTLKDDLAVIHLLPAGI